MRRIEPLPLETLESRLDDPLTLRLRDVVSQVDPQTLASGGQFRGQIGAGVDPLDAPLDPYESTYADAYDGVIMAREDLDRMFSRSMSTLRWHAARGNIRPDDISEARQLGYIDDFQAQRLANISLDALERRGFTDLPREIRYTPAGPFYIQLRDDQQVFDAFKAAIGHAGQSDFTAVSPLNSEGQPGWDYKALEEMAKPKKDGRPPDLQVVDRYGRPVDIFKTAKIDGRPERVLNLKIPYNDNFYEPGKNNRSDSVNGEFVMVEAWNADLSEPEPGMIYEVPVYDPETLWRFETGAETDHLGRPRVEHVSGVVDIIPSYKAQIRTDLEKELGRPPTDDEYGAAVDEYESAKRWAKNNNMHYVRYEPDQRSAGNPSMIEADMREALQLDENGEKIKYRNSRDRYNGGHIIAASLGGFGEFLNVTAQLEGNNQDRRQTTTVVMRGPDSPTVRAPAATFVAGDDWHDWEDHLQHKALWEQRALTLDQLAAHGFEVTDAMRTAHGDGPLQVTIEQHPEGGAIATIVALESVTLNETWHDWERHIKNLALLSDGELTLMQLEDQGFDISPAVYSEYGSHTPVEFEIETAISLVYEDEAFEGEDPERRTNREFARVTSTRLRDKRTGRVLAVLDMSNLNVGGSDSDFQWKVQMLFDAGLLDAEGGYARDADMRPFKNPNHRAPDFRYGGTLNDELPTERQIRSVMNSPFYEGIWGPNVFDE